MLFPPELVPHVRSAIPGHQGLADVSDPELAQLLTLVFFASLEAEEGDYLPIRVLFSDSAPAAPGIAESPLAWTHWRFSKTAPCTAKSLRRLSRATVPDWTFIQVGIVGGELRVLGLARRMVSVDDERFVRIVSPAPGRLEIWSGGHRVLEYAHGRLMPAPENLLLSTGPVQRALSRAAERAGVSTQGRSTYLECVAGIVRAMAAHGHGGMLVIASLVDAPLPGQSGFLTESPHPTLLAALRQLDEFPGVPPTEASQRSQVVLRAALHVSMDSAIAEIGGLTALDGATLLEPTLAVRAFGVILPAIDRPTVMQAADAEPGDLSPFSLEERGARHRAAAGFAHNWPESIVFVASADGDLGCMLQDPDSERVLAWRWSAARSVLS